LLSALGLPLPAAITGIAGWNVPERLAELSGIGSGLPNSGNHSYGYAPSGLAGAALITPNLPALASIDQNQTDPARLNLRTDRDSNGTMGRPFLPAAE